MRRFTGGGRTPLSSGELAVGSQKPERPGRVQAVGPVLLAARRLGLTEYGSVPRPLRPRIGSVHEAHDLPASHALCRHHRRRCRRPARRGYGARPGGRDKGQPGSVHQRDEPARDRGRARHVRVRAHRRGGSTRSAASSTAARRNRLRALPRRRGDVDARASCRGSRSTPARSAIRTVRLSASATRASPTMPGTTSG